MYQDPNPAKIWIYMARMCIGSNQENQGEGINWSLGSFGCDPKMQEELKTRSLCSGNVKIVQEEVLILPNFHPATANFSSAANSATVLQQLNVKMIFLVMNALKKNQKTEQAQPSLPKSIMFTNLAQPMVSHGDAPLQFNLCGRSILQQAQCSRRDSGVFAFKQHQVNLWMAQLWAATYKKWFLGSCCPDEEVICLTLW